ncbi:MAG: GNAT family N-acetyltransferase [Dehalococcoidia bacterium]
MVTTAVVPMVLQGRFVRLEPLTPDHVPALVAAADGPRDTYGFTWVPGDEAAARDYVETALRWQAEGTAIPFATYSLTAGRVVGSTRFANISYWDWPPGNPNQRGPELPDDVEIGWTWLSADAQRTPVNSEAKLLMLTHAFETWRVHRVNLKTDARNWRSRNAIERIGGKLDGVIRAQQPAFDGTVRDNAWFTMLASEWPAVKLRLEQKLA